MLRPNFDYVAKNYIKEWKGDKFLHIIPKKILDVKYWWPTYLNALQHY